MTSIEFNNTEKELLSQKLKRYMADELSMEIGQFDSEFLLDYISEHIGIYYYNKGLSDAQQIFKDRVDSTVDAIYELEFPTEFSGK